MGASDNALHTQGTHKAPDKVDKGGHVACTGQVVNTDRDTMHKGRRDEADMYRTVQTVQASGGDVAGAGLDDWK